MEQQNTVTTTRKITRLLFDCGYKSNSSYRCGVCNFRVNEYMNQDTDDYTKSRPQMVEHLRNEHPEFCYKCDKCEELCVTKKDVATHKRENHKKTKKSTL